MHAINIRPSLLAVTVSIASGFSASAYAADAGWEGWYGGLHLGRTAHHVATAYSH